MALIAELTWKTLLVWDLQLSAFHMSNRTKQVNVMVVSRFVLPPDPSSISRWNTYKVPKMMMPADKSTLMMRDFEIIGSFTFRGFRFRTSWSTGSTPDGVGKKYVNLYFVMLFVDSYQATALVVHPLWC